MMKLNEVMGLIQKAEHAKAWSSTELQRKWKGASEYPVDEISLLFTTEVELMSFVVAARSSGKLDHFRSVRRDTMARQDGSGEHFDVRFEFLRLNNANWRIEAMTVLSGTAPLHRQLLRSEGEGCVAHASFKCPGATGYGAVKVAMAGQSVAFAAEYRNSYGLFSYWGYGPYWKPRVNLRDV